jgi:hypothetical protein
MPDMTHLRNPAHPDLGRPLDESLTPKKPEFSSDGEMHSAEEGAPDMSPSFEQDKNTYNEGSAEMVQGAFDMPHEDVSTFSVPDRGTDQGVPNDPLTTDAHARPMK